MNSRRSCQRFNRDHASESRQGAAVVELALVMPFLMILALGTCELGQAYKIDAILCTATRAGCATGTRPGCSNADVISDIQAVLTVNKLSASLATVTILVNDVAGDVASASLNDKITVRVSVPTAQVVVATMLTYLSDKPVLSQTTTMMKQG